ncbi:MAG: arsenate reductase ArsC [Bauldia sp.]|nr:arsenate reductase ArsC [Bauldia sp.]MCW5716437.1 arsenate reductase ArsC [Bauldia sp.]
MAVESDQVLNVLFLCTHNSARSILAECIMNRWGAPRFRAFSAGSHPRGEIRPEALGLLRHLNFDVSNLRSKSWDEFAAPGAPHLHFVFTVCDDAANEVCPVWPGQPMTAHWGIADPGKAEGTDAEVAIAFANAYRQLNNRITIFVALPFRSLDRMALKERLDEIGRTDDARPA